jgi:hypothetical protein
MLSNSCHCNGEHQAPEKNQTLLQDLVLLQTQLLT